MKRALLMPLIGALALSGCITYRDGGHGLTYLRIGETGTVGGPRVTPLKLLEDSRCPEGVQCVWAGRVRVSVRIDLPSGSQTRDMTLGEPQPVADGTLTLADVVPAKKKDETIYPDQYRFGFRFDGGL